VHAIATEFGTVGASVSIAFHCLPREEGSEGRPDREDHRCRHNAECVTALTVPRSGRFGRQPQESGARR